MNAGCKPSNSVKYALCTVLLVCTGNLYTFIQLYKLKYSNVHKIKESHEAEVLSFEYSKRRSLVKNTNDGGKLKLNKNLY